jgi:hypothetical protein
LYPPSDEGVVDLTRAEDDSDSDMEDQELTSVEKEKGKEKEGEVAEGGEIQGESARSAPSLDVELRKQLSRRYSQASRLASASRRKTR